MLQISSPRSLLLNASYEPMRVITWQKALVLWFQGKADILEFHTAFARSINQKFQLPSVIRLRRYVARKKPQHYVRFCREHVYIRDNYTCQYCGHAFGAKHLTLDHVIPASQNGPKNWTNMVTACRDCNQKKANRTPATANMPLLQEPKTPLWLPTLKLEIGNKEIPEDWTPYLAALTG